MSKKRNGLEFDACIGSELADTQGEILDVAGADISDLMASRGIVNVDHAKGFYNLVGRVTGAKKIFSEKDCDNDRHRYYWNKIKAPLIYASAYLFDEDDHPHAKATAAILRNIHRTDSPLKLKASVEGGILQRDPKDNRRLSKTKVIGFALTFVPANNATLVETTSLVKSHNVEADYALMNSIKHLAKTDIPSFRTITRHASATTIANNIAKIEEMAKSLGIENPLSKVDIDELIQKSVEEKIKSNVYAIVQLAGELQKTRNLDAPHPSFVPPKEARPTYLPRTETSKQRLSETGSTTEKASGKYTVDPNDAKTNLASVGVDANQPNLNAATKAVEIHETQHSKNQNIANQLKNASGGPVDSDDFSKHAIMNAGLDPHERHFLNHFVPAYSGSYGVNDPDETMSVVSEALSGRDTLRGPALKALQEHLPNETKESMLGRLKDIHKKLSNTYGQYEAGQKLNIPSDEEYSAHFDAPTDAYMPRVNPHLNKTLAAGYGAASAPSDRTGGSVLQSEHLPMGRGFKYLKCDNCGHDQIFMDRQVKCRECNKPFSFEKLARVLIR